MALRPHGRARVDPNRPEMFAKCDRCYTQYNHVELRWQYRYAGTGLVNTGMLVCPSCYDAPNPQERTIVLPADPPPKFNQRMENWQLDESNRYTIQSPTPGTSLFRSQGLAVASMFSGPVFTRAADMSVSSAALATAIQVKRLAPDLSVTSVALPVVTQYYGFSNFGAFVIGG